MRPVTGRERLAQGAEDDPKAGDQREAWETLKRTGSPRPPSLNVLSVDNIKENTRSYN